MANMELHGFDAQKREFVKEAIWAAAFNRRFGNFKDELVVSEVASEVKDKSGRHQPFVRVFFTGKAELATCKAVLEQVSNLRKCFFDAEFIHVIHFCSFPPKAAK